jgi:DNA modification methylase
MSQLGIKCLWKPLLWFVKDYRGDGRKYVQDVVWSSKKEKELHEWQQPLGEAEYYISKLTSKKGVVVDFCVGSGTTLVAARNLGRSWVGFEIDPDTARIAAKRLEGR